MSKTIYEQINETKIQIEKAEKEIKQLRNQEARIVRRDRTLEHKKRTRRLIERGAILEKINPSIASLSNEQLQEYLNKVLHTDSALDFLEKMINANLTQ